METMTAQEMKPRLYVGTYAKYNNGSIAGAWVDLEDFDSAEEFEAHCKELHSDEEDPEFMYQDYEGFPERLYSESGNVEPIFEYLEAVKDMDEDEREAFEIWIDNGSGTDVDDFKDQYRGWYKDMEDFAEELLSEGGSLDEVPEGLRSYIDFKAYGRDLELGGDFWIKDGHVFSNH